MNITPAHGVTSTRMKYFLSGIAIMILAALAVPSFLRYAGLDTPKGTPKHLILIVLDTVRADHMSVYGYQKPTTPFLQDRAGEFVLFENVKSVAPWTVPSIASMFTGQWPSEHKAQWGYVHLSEKLQTLAETLSKKGFDCLGFSCNPFVTKKFGFGDGFKSFRKNEGTWAQCADKTLAALPEEFDKVIRRHRRMFLFLNLMDAHIPYNSADYGTQFGLNEPDPVTDHVTKWKISAGDRPFTGHDKDLHIAAYDASIRRLDDVIREIYDLLMRKGMLEKSLLVLTSDHGEGLGLHPEIGHEISMWEEQLAVPLLIRYPTQAHGGEKVSARTSLIGLMPELLDRMGVGRPPALRGRSDLLGIPPDGVAADYRNYFGDGELEDNQKIAAMFPRLAARTHDLHVMYCGTNKLIAQNDGLFQFYDLAVDPSEQNDLADSRPPVMINCREQYSRFLALGRLTPFQERLNPGEVSDAQKQEARKALRSLGYTQ